MRARNATFWSATVIAAVLALCVAYELFYGMEQDFPVLNIPGLVTASAIWAVGWLCRLAL
jgi:hypothetical protein